MRRGLEPEVLTVKQNPPVEQTRKKAGEDPGRRVPDQTSRRCVNSSGLQPLGDRSRRRTRGTMPSFSHDWVWSASRMAARERVHQQYLEHLEQALRREPVQGVGVETPGAAVVVC